MKAAAISGTRIEICLYINVRIHIHILYVFCIYIHIHIALHTFCIISFYYVYIYIHTLCTHIFSSIPRLGSNSFAPALGGASRSWKLLLVWRPQVSESVYGGFQKLGAF